MKPNIIKIAMILSSITYILNLLINKKSGFGIIWEIIIKKNIKNPFIL